MSITRTFTIEDIDPSELAAVFCEMSADHQAVFFTRVGEIAATWPGTGWCQQSCSISEHLDKVGAETILKIAAYAADPFAIALAEGDSA